MYTYNSGGNFLTNLQNHQMQNEMLYQNVNKGNHQSDYINSFQNQPVPENQVGHINQVNHINPGLHMNQGNPMTMPMNQGNHMNMNQMGMNQVSHFNQILDSFPSDSYSCDCLDSLA